jgi:hypothetical protein
MPAVCLAQLAGWNWRLLAQGLKLACCHAGSAGGDKCAKCNVPVDQGGCKCDDNCDCKPGSSNGGVGGGGGSSIIGGSHLTTDTDGNSEDGAQQGSDFSGEHEAG